MNIQESVTEALKSTNPDVVLNEPGDYENKLRDLGIDSIQFLNVVMTVCDSLGVDVGQINSMEVSTENSVNEFINNFKPYVPNSVPA